MAGLDRGTASAAPPQPDPSPAASCVYTLTPPSKVTVSGTEMVTASLKPGPCTGDINPNTLTVCLELKGYASPQCATHPTFDPVDVYFSPYRSGATYIATGLGCGNVFPTGDQSCSPVGPYATTL
ncbi:MULTISPECIES: hypothetical protein [unclassified Mycobacterium]|uniref:hypothetical protein n=1 Tax=unclassified Mycobacterium TaxID=2642494 RepID=UPI0029C7C7EE|nr:MULTISPECIES: hypothetical protein [unclassified Mycobacterium]